MATVIFPGNEAQHYVHGFPFDPTHGYAPNELLAIEPPAGPEDFVDFWKETRCQWRGHPTHPRLSPSSMRLPGVDVFNMVFNAHDGFEIGGWLTRPKEGPILGGMVVGHGYGGRGGPEPRLPVEQAVAIYPCARGISLSTHPNIPENPQQHILAGIESRESFILRDCVADLWSAVEALLELHPEAEQRLDYMGTSFAGGIGVLALPWEPRFRRAHVSVPTFGHHMLRSHLPCIGSGQAIAARLESHPEVEEVLGYFDAAVAARHLHLPVHVAAALFDPAVPPAGQFSVYNALPGPRHLFILHAGHFAYPEAPQDSHGLHQALQSFFG